MTAKNNKSKKKRYTHPIKEVVREATAGGVVFRRNDNGDLQILMIQDPKGRWTIPKGHIEKGEKPHQTAEREIQEETGLEEMKILDYLGKINFKYRRQNSLILMTTQIYLVKALGDTDDIQKEEYMKGIKWFNHTDALDEIAYEDIAKLFLLGYKKIRQGGY